MRNRMIAALIAATGFAAHAFGTTNANAAEVLVSENITVSQTWTPDNVYRLQAQIYVMPGATLTIEAGTVVASTAGLGGSLAVTRGARIFVNGTCDAPVIMTSTADVATWTADSTHPTGGDPKTGVWREAVNEWGNLTIMGEGLISASHFGGEPIPGNTKLPTGLNRKQMEGLVAAAPGDPNVLYGGANDDDDSGSIRHLSIRYGGKVVGLGNELNGMSLGGVGRETEIDHVEIMNNVDDGIEIWGGTVNLKHVSVWNIGDDSVDVDQGWRGKMQYGLIVQGFSADANQGSGVGDNMFETDGAEDSDAQPVTTSTIYNFTAIGQPIDGDHATAWRDNARVQYRNCIFMNAGEKLVKFDNSDGDGGSGYGFNGTLTWEQTWATAAGVDSLVNAIDPVPAVGAFNHPDTLYQVQTGGTLAEISDSVFFQNSASAYSDSDVVGVTIGGASNPALNNVVAEASPIRSITRGELVSRGGKNMLPVIALDPLPSNDALVAAASAPDDGFFTPAAFRGGFAPDFNWLAGWSASHAFGFVAPTNGCAGPTPTPTPTPAPATRLGNISTRGFVGVDASVMIAGVIVEGTEPRRMLVSGIGPDLENFGVTGALANPALTLLQGQNVIATNDDWQSASNASEIEASDFTPNNSLEAAILTDLAPGEYTAILSGNGESEATRTGVGLVQAFDLGPVAGGTGDSRVRNISTRLAVGTGDRVMIGGFRIDGDAPKTVLVRGLGPTLGAPPFNVPGTLGDPELRLFDTANPPVQIQFNDDWRDSEDMQLVVDSGLAPGDDAEPAILATLPPGSYTAIVSGVAGAEGVALIEVYEVRD